MTENIKKYCNGWIEKAYEKDSGGEIFLPCHDGAYQTFLLKAFKKEMKSIAQFSMEISSSISIRPVYRKSAHWIVLRKETLSHEVGFYKKGDKTERIKVKEK